MIQIWFFHGEKDFMSSEPEWWNPRDVSWACQMFLPFGIWTSAELLFRFL